MDIQGIILAAGFSSRFGKHKMLTEINGKSLIEHTISTMSVVCTDIFVVCGYKFDEMNKKLKDIPKVTIIHNKNFEDGMFSSVKVGVSMINSERFFLTPGDIPFVSKDTFESMMNSEADIVIPMYKGRKGHPVLIKSSYVKEIIDEPQNSNLKLFLNAKGYETIDVDDANILKDVDTIEDLKNFDNGLNMN